MPRAVLIRSPDQHTELDRGVLALCPDATCEGVGFFYDADELATHGRICCSTCGGRWWQDPTSNERYWGDVFSAIVAGTHCDEGRLYSLMEYGGAGVGTWRVEDIEIRDGYILIEMAMRGIIDQVGRATLDRLSTEELLVGDGLALRVASAYGHADVVRYLLHRTRDRLSHMARSEAIIYAENEGHPDIVELLIE